MIGGITLLMIIKSFAVKAKNHIKVKNLNQRKFKPITLANHLQLL